MRTVSIQDLKRHLSAILREAARGKRFLITRHNRPLAQLEPPRSDHVHRGSRFGRGEIRPVLKEATQGRFLEILQDDRRGPEPS